MGEDHTAREGPESEERGWVGPATATAIAKSYGPDPELQQRRGRVQSPLV